MISVWGVDHGDVVSKRTVKVGEYVYHTSRNILPRLNMEGDKVRLARRATTHVFDKEGKKVGHFTTSRDLRGADRKTSQVHYASHTVKGSGIGEEALRQSMKSLKTDKFRHSKSRTPHGNSFTERTSSPGSLKDARPWGDESTLKRPRNGEETKVKGKAKLKAKAFAYRDDDRNYLLYEAKRKPGQSHPLGGSGSRAERHATAAGTTAVGAGLVYGNRDPKKKGKGQPLKGRQRRDQTGRFS